MVLILVTTGLILGRVRLGGREREGGEREWRKKDKWNKRKILEGRLGKERWEREVWYRWGKRGGRERERESEFFSHKRM